MAVFVGLRNQLWDPKERPLGPLQPALSPIPEASTFLFSEQTHR